MAGLQGLVNSGQQYAAWSHADRNQQRKAKEEVKMLTYLQELKAAREKVNDRLIALALLMAKDGRDLFELKEELSLIELKIEKWETKTHTITI